MINDIFNFFEELLYKWADIFGISYELLNIIYLPNQAFALPSSKKIKITIKEKNEFKFFTVKKDDCIYNYLTEVLMALKNRRYDSFYHKIIQDAQIRNNLFKKIKK